MSQRQRNITDCIRRDHIIMCQSLRHDRVRDHPPPLPLEYVGRGPGEISEKLSTEVFENPMLREKILNFVIYSKGKVSRRNLKTVRLIRSTWLQTTAESMRKVGVPVFTLTLNNDLRKLLGKFVSTMTSPIEITDFIQFSLKLMPQFFRKENHQNLSDCLLYCGGGLLDLNISFPINSSMTLIFPSFHLPKLRGFTFQFTGQPLNQSSAVDLYSTNGSTIYYLQSILNATDELKVLNFKNAPSGNLVPLGFEYLVVPKTVTKLCLDCPLTNTDLQLLIKNNLPNLYTLRLSVFNTPDAGVIISQVLEKFQKTLCKLVLKGYQYGDFLTSNLLKIPVMEKLETVTITSPFWKFEEDLDHLESLWPKMSDLRILNIGRSMFKKWTKSCKFEAVQGLTVSLMDKMLNSVPVTLQRMQKLHFAFPNVVSLDIRFCGPQTFGLRYIFQEMRSLKHLQISAVETIGEEQYHPGHWDSVLIGVPVEMVMSFRENPHFLDYVDLKYDGSIPSIQRLTALKSFGLVDLNSTSVPGEPMTPLISDLTFHLAFLKMPNLKELMLIGRFGASTQIAESWMQLKGTGIVGNGKKCRYSL